MCFSPQNLNMLNSTSVVQNPPSHGGVEFHQDHDLKDHIIEGLWAILSHIGPNIRYLSLCKTWAKVGFPGCTPKIEGSSCMVFNCAASRGPTTCNTKDQRLGAKEDVSLLYSKSRRRISFLLGVRPLFWVPWRSRYSKSYYDKQKGTLRCAMDPTSCN